MPRDEMIKYFLGNMYKTKGYMHPADALMFAALLNHQSELGVSGDVIEIGIYYGRSFCLLAKAITDRERAIGIDLFSIGPRENGAHSQSEQYETFLQNLSGNQIDITKCSIHIGSSDELDVSQLMDSPKKARFIHIDGGHDRESVTHDLVLATSVLCEQGIIVLDDFLNPEWPGVTIAVLEFLNENVDYAPFAITRGKLYVCRSRIYP